MEPTMTDAEANGVILWHKAAFTVRVERSLLMLDAKSWAQWIAKMEREEAARCEWEGRIRALAEVNAQIREIERWLVTGKGLCKTTHVLYRRKLFAAPAATAVSCDVYVRKLLRLRAGSSPAPSPEFILDANWKPPNLYVLEDMSAAARHTGPYVRGRVIGRQEMLRLVLGALRESNQSLRLFPLQEDLLN